LPNLFPARETACSYFASPAPTTAIWYPRSIICGMELGDDPQKGLVARGIEAELLLELFAVDGFLLEALGAVVLVDVAVGFRVPFFVVDAVQYTDEVVLVTRHPFQDGVEAVGVFALPYLLGVRRAHRRDDVGVEYAALEEIDLSVELEALRGEEEFREAELVEYGSFVLPLKGDVVYREDDARILEELVVAEVFPPPEAYRQKSCLPVVAVYDVGPEAERLYGFERGEGEEAEPEVVVLVVGGGSGVDVLPSVKVLLLDEVNRYAAQLYLLHHASHGQPVDAHDEVFYDVLRFYADRGEIGLYAGVVRENHPDVGPLRGEPFGEGAYDVGETAHPCKGLHFRGDEEDIHS
jgi:hypothetical protein